MRTKIYNSIRERKKLLHNSTRIKLFIYSIIIGLLSGTAVVAYRTSIDKIVLLRNYLLTSTYGEYIVLILFLIGSAIIQTGLNLHPMISGSGIPQVMGALRSITVFNWIYEFIYKFCCGIVAIFMGMSLGREGPSIHLGALIADGISLNAKHSEIEKKYLLTAGASAGLSAAFNAPLSGTIFALEELHKFFSPLLLICSMVASIGANFMAQYFLGKSVVFKKFDFTSPLQESIKPLAMEIFLIVILAVILALGGKLFNFTLVKFQKIYKKIKMNRYTKMAVFAFILFYITKYLPDITGGGHSLIESLIIDDYTFKFVILLLVTKFLLTHTSYSTGTPGGIFLPLLVIGALIGKAYGMFVTNIFHLNQTYIIHFMLLAMAGYFTAIVRSPIVGTVLVLELTGNFSNLFPLTMISAITYVLSELLKTEPVYELLYEGMFNKDVKKEKLQKEKDRIITLLIPVVSSSKIVGMQINEIDFPENMLVVGIERNGLYIIPNYKTKVFSGDKLTVLTSSKSAVLELENMFNITLKENLD